MPKQTPSRTDEECARALARESLSDGLNRRSFLERASLSAMGIAFAGAGTSPFGSVSLAQHNPLPEQLGRGFLTTGDLVRILIADLDASSPQWRGEGGHQWDVDFATSRSSYASLVSGSARVKFGGTSVGGEARASASKAFRSGRNTVHLVVWKKVQTGHHTLDVPRLRPDVRSVTSPWEFVTRFGDRLIDRVTLGGELYIIYTLEFDREEKASSVTASGTGKYKVSSASAAIHSAVRSESSGAKVSMRGFCSGVKTVPPLITNGAALGIDDSGVPDLLKFWDHFDEMVASDGVAAPIEFRAIDMRDVRDVGVDLDAMRAFDRAIDKCEGLDDVIDERLAALTYLKARCLAWNTHVDLQDLSRREQQLRTAASDLSEWVEPRMELRKVASFSDPFVPPVTESELATIPDNWICRDLRQDAAWRMKFYGANTGVTVRQDLPARLIPGQHIEIRGRVTKYGKSRRGDSGPFVNGNLRFDNGDAIRTFSPMENRGEDVSSVVRVPAGAKSVVLAGTAYGSGPLVVDLSLWA